MGSIVSRPVRRYDHLAQSIVEDRLVVEAPVELRIGETPLAVLMRTPGHDSNLALGFVLTEGILLNPQELVGTEQVGEGDRLRLILADGVDIDPEQFRRNAYTTSSCGVCGKASIDAVRLTARPLPPGPLLDPSFLASLPSRLADAQPDFAATGGLHGAAIYHPDGRLAASAEDIGRHNAVDKAIGQLARTRWPLGEVVLMVSGRVSFEIAQKAAVAGIPVVAGVSAGSSLAAELAEEVGMTLVGFLRGESMVVYADTNRLEEDRSP